MWKTIIGSLAIAVAALLEVPSGPVHADPGADDPHLPDIAAGYCPGGYSDNEYPFGMLHRCIGTPYDDGTYWIQNQWFEPTYPFPPNHPYGPGLNCVTDTPRGAEAAPASGCRGAA